MEYNIGETKLWKEGNESDRKACLESDDPLGLTLVIAVGYYFLGERERLYKGYRMFSNNLKSPIDKTIVVSEEMIEYMLKNGINKVIVDHKDPKKVEKFTRIAKMLVGARYW
jgi:hypothetical protein